MGHDVFVIRATGIGSWPGTDPREAIVTVRDLMLDAGGGASEGADGAEGLGIPYLPETPARGPGADIIGRGAGLLTDLPVELTPSGWRLTGRPGRDAERTASLWSQDLDELTEAYDGYVGPLKVAVAGPWTLAAAIELPRGEKALADLGACLELAESLADGARALIARLATLIPGARIILQLDEPTLPAVLAGSLPTASGYSRLRPIDGPDVLHGLRTVTQLVPGETVLHSCHPTAPIPLLRNSGADALALDLTEASSARWESIAATLESDIGVYAGLVPTDGSGSVRTASATVLEEADRVGIDGEHLASLVISPACGLAGSTRDAAIALQRMTIDLAHELHDTIAAG